MKLLLTYILISLTALNLYTQAPDIEWQKCLGDTASESINSVLQLLDGSYIVAGSTTSNSGYVIGNHGSSDVWFLKLDSYGNILWQKCFGGTGSESAISIKQTIDNGYIFVGTSNSVDGDVSGNHGFYDIWVVKLDSIGTIQWQKSIGGTNNENAENIKLCSDGGYIICGRTYSNDGDVSGNHGLYDCWVVKLDSIGNIQWQKCYGGSSQDFLLDILQINNGYILSGSTASNNGDVIGNNGGTDLWLIKIDTIGNIQWQKCLGGTGTEEGQFIHQCTNGEYIIAGCSNSNNGYVSGNHGGYDYWIVRIDSIGTIKWQNCYGGTNDDWAHTIQLTSDGGYIVEGNSLSNDGDVSGNHGDKDYWILKLDSIGTIQWQKCLGGLDIDWAKFIQITSDGGYIVSGFTESVDGDVIGNHGDSDSWIVKLCGTFNYYNDTIICYGDSIFWQGSYLSTTGIYFDSLQTIGGCDSIFEMHLNVQSNYFVDQETICNGDSIFWHNDYYSFLGIYNDSLLSTIGCDSIFTLDLSFIIIDTSIVDNGSILTAVTNGAQYQWVNCDSSFTPIIGENNQSFTPTTNGNYAVIITINGCTDTSFCYNVNSVGLSKCDNLNIFIFPNPTTGIIRVEADNLQKIEVIDIQDKQIYIGKETEIDLSTQPNGIYIIEIITDKQTMTRKLIKQ
ncbi:MAG: T9SS type A sorting domain-containing protein [Bacteroidota bacterium]